VSRLPLVLLPAQLCDAELDTAQAAALADLAEPWHLNAVAPTLSEAAQTILAARGLDGGGAGVAATAVGVRRRERTGGARTPRPLRR
jgi:hypothetical protein